MARKRMFDSEIINQDSFLELSMESKALYFLLGMEADDEGFVSYKKVLRLYGGTEDSLKLLIIKKYIIPFKSGVVVITDWKRNNYLDKNRIKETIYQIEKSLLIFNEQTERYELKEGLTEVKQMLNQNSIEENSIEESIINNICPSKDVQMLQQTNDICLDKCTPEIEIEKEIEIDNICPSKDGQSITDDKNNTTSSEKKVLDNNVIRAIEIYNLNCSNLPQIKKVTDKRKKAIKSFLKEFTIEQLEEICKIANGTDFLIGKNDRGWKADFDFIMRTDKATAILEGKYSNAIQQNKKENILKRMEGKIKDENR